MTEKPATNKPTSSRKPKTKRRQPDQREISKRAYFITSKRANAISSETGCARSAS